MRPALAAAHKMATPYKMCKATSSELIESKFWHIKFNVVAEIRIRDMVCFGPSSSELTSQSEETLRSVAMCAKEHRLQRLTIEGHTCDQGPDNFNQELSEERAESVEKFLKQLGCGDMNLRVVGFGSKLPMAAATDERAIAEYNFYVCEGNSTSLQ